MFNLPTSLFVQIPANPRHCTRKHEVKFSVITQPYLILPHHQNMPSLLCILALCLFTSLESAYADMWLLTNTGLLCSRFLA